MNRFYRRPSSVPVAEESRVSSKVVGIVREESGAYVASTNTGEFDLDDDIVRIFDLGNWPILKGDFVHFLEDKRWVLQFDISLAGELKELKWGRGR